MADSPTHDGQSLSVATENLTTTDIPKPISTSQTTSQEVDLKTEPEFIDVPRAEIVDLDRIVVGDRGRKDMGNLMEIVDSIKAVGFIQSFCVEVIKDAIPGTKDLLLVAGGRRWRACMMLGIKKVPVVIKENYTRYQSTLAELLENLKRKSMEWPEEVAMREKLWQLKRAEFGIGGTGSTEGWNLKKQAAFLNQQQTQSQDDLQLAKVMRERGDVADKIRHLNKTVALRRAKEILHEEKLSKQIISGEISTSSKILLGNCLDLIREIEDSSIDLIITDPPFGIDEILDQVGNDRGVSTSYTAFLQASDNSSLRDVEKLLEDLAPEIFRVLKPGGHFYIFHCAQLYNSLTSSLRKAGLHYDHAPLIWYKKKATTKFQGLSYPSCYEPILFGCKPPRTQHLLDPKVRNVLEYEPLHTSKKIHPFMKPPLLIEELIKNSSRKGDTILDPFAGSGVVIRTAQELSRNGLGFELDQKNWNLAQVYLNLGAEAVIGGKS